MNLDPTSLEGLDDMALHVTPGVLATKDIHNFLFEVIDDRGGVLLICQPASSLNCIFEGPRFQRCLGESISMRASLFG